MALRSLLFCVRLPSDFSSGWRCFGGLLRKVSRKGAKVAKVPGVLFFRAFKYFNAILKFLGTVSFEIYLCHVGVMDIIIALNGEMSSNLFVGLTFGLTILLAFIIHSADSKVVKLLRRG